MSDRLTKYLEDLIEDTKDKMWALPPTALHAASEYAGFIRGIKAVLLHLKNNSVELPSEPCVHCASPWHNPSGELVREGNDLVQKETDRWMKL